MRMHRITHLSIKRSDTGGEFLAVSVQVMRNVKCVSKRAVCLSATLRCDTINVQRCCDSDMLKVRFI